MNARLPRIRRACVVPRLDEQLPLLGGQDREIANLRIGRRHHAREQRFQVRGHARDRRLDEQIGGVLNPARQRAVGGLAHREGQIELGCGHVGHAAAHLEPRTPARRSGPRRRRGVEREEHLEERRSAQITLWIQLLHEPLEGRVLVRIRAQARLLHPREQLAERRARRGLRADHQRVEEEADEPLRLGAAPVGDRRADGHVLLPAVPVEQRRVRREERHEERRALALREIDDGPRERPRQRERVARPAVRRDRRARPIRGQIEHARGALQLGPPVGELLLGDLAREPAPLPGRVVGVLDRQLRQR
ncbi:MAG: hypothetical protein QM820_02455 [Minicystis sp.]